MELQPFQQSLLKGHNKNGFTQRKMTAKLAMNKMEQAAEISVVKPSTLIIRNIHRGSRLSRAPRIRQLSLLVFAKSSAFALRQGWSQTGLLPI